MFGLKTFLAGLFLGSATALIAMQIHVVNTNDGLIVLPRSHRPPITSTYVDVRQWSMSMWRQHPEVAEAALKSGRVDLLGDGALNSIFPKQAELETVPASKLATAKAKLAMEELVPFKFTNSEGKEKVISPMVPNPIQAQDWLPRRATTQSKVSAQSGEVFPHDFKINESLLRGLPKLQRPIPIFDDILPQQQNSQTHANDSQNKTEAPDLFTDILKALIPGSNSNEQATIIPLRQHGMSYPAFQVEAPAPGSQHRQVKPQSNIIQPAPVPAVRPF